MKKLNNKYIKSLNSRFRTISFTGTEIPSFGFTLLLLCNIWKIEMVF